MRRTCFLRQVLLLGALSVSLCAARAQADLSAAGGDTSSGDHALSFTIGQAFAQVYDDPAGSVYHGVQQPYELFVVSVQQHTDRDWQVRLFPNPTSGWLLLEIRETELPSGLRYVLQDLHGRPLDARVLAGPTTEISLLHQPPGTYFLSLFQDDLRVQSFQIQKQ